MPPSLACCPSRADLAGNLPYGLIDDARLGVLLLRRADRSPSRDSRHLRCPRGCPTAMIVVRPVPGRGVRGAVRWGAARRAVWSGASRVVRVVVVLGGSGHSALKGRDMAYGRSSFDGWLERIHPADREGFTREVEGFLASGARHGRVEYRLAEVDGGYKPVVERFVAERGPEGRPVRVVSMVEEVQESVPAATEEGEPEGGVEVPDRGPVDEDRPGAPDARPGERADVLGTLRAVSERLARARSLDEVVLGELVEHIPGGLRVAEPAARIVVGPLEVATLDFDPETARVHPLPSDRDGGPPGSVSVSFRGSAPSDPAGPDLPEEDVAFLREVAARLTETARRIRAAEARRPEEPYHRLLVEGSGDLLAVVDPDGTIRFVGPAAERLLGYDPASLVGSDGLELVHPDDRAAAEEALAEAASDPDRVPTIEHRIRHADGTWRWFESTGRSFQQDPDVRGIVIDSRDVTVRKGQEGQLRHARKMEAVARLAGGLAHEFNNLLTVIRVSIRLLDDLFEGVERPEELDDIEAAAAGAAVLTQRLLAFSGRDIRSPRVLDLAAVLEELRGFLSRTAGDDVEVELDVSRTPLPILADPLQVEQVVLNLFANALEAVPGGGRVAVEARTARPGELPPQVRRPDRWVLLRVVDSGPGVPDDVRDRIFDPFFTTKEGATGLGLATVGGIVSRLGGFVDVGRDLGGGARFTVCLPKSEDGQPPPSRAETAAETDAEAAQDVAVEFPRGRTVLVVEHDAASRSLLERLLSGAGYRVLEAHDGVSALTLLDAYGGPLDLLVCASEMPHVTGEELATRVMATHPDAAVLYVSSVEPDRPGLAAVRRDELSRDLLPAVEDLLGEPV